MQKNETFPHKFGLICTDREAYDIAISSNIENKTMIISINRAGQTSDLTTFYNFPINGTLPTTSGKKKISIEAKTNSTGEVYVEISSS